MSRHHSFGSLFAGVILLAVIAGVFSACSVTTSPDDSIAAPHKGSHVYVRTYGLDTRTRQVPVNAPFSVYRDTVTLDTMTYMGFSNVQAVTRSGPAYLGPGTLYVNYAQNGDLFLYRPEIRGISQTSIPGFWLRLPFGSKVDNDFQFIDTVQIHNGNTIDVDTLLAKWSITFEGPGVVTTFDLLNPEVLNTVKVRMTEEIIGGADGYNKIDIIYDYAPAIGYLVRESVLESDGKITTGYERVIDSYEIIK